MKGQRLKFFKKPSDPYCLYFLLEGFEHRVARWVLTMTCEAKMSNEWVAFENPEVCLFKTANLPTPEKTLHWFLREIPDPVRELAANILYFQISALRLMRLTRYSQDLLQDVPALFWLLCGQLSRRKISYNNAARLIAGKRKTIIEHLLGETVFTSNLFRIIRLFRFDEDTYSSLLGFVNVERGKPAIRHARNLDLLVSYGYSYDRRIISSHIVEECAASDNPELLERAREIGEAVMMFGGDCLPPITMKELLRCRTYRQLDKLYTELQCRPRSYDLD